MNDRTHLAPRIYVGLDVHKDSVDIGLAQAGREGEVRQHGATRESHGLCAPT
jgi:hypothetical protein